MIEAVYEFGKLKTGKFPGVPLEKVNADYLVILDIDGEGRLKNIELTKNISEIEDKLLHKPTAGGKNPPNLTPTLRLGEIKKSLKNIKKILGNLRKFEDSISLFRDLDEVANKIREELVKSGLLEVNQKSPSSKLKIFITLRINGKFIGEIPEFRKAFEKFYLSKLGKLKIGICSLCGRKTLVSGERSPFTFYTLDKIGYLSGFSKKYHVRGFPICPDCYKILDRAKIELANHSFKLTSGVEYLLIPNAIRTGIDNELLENVLDLQYLKSRLKLEKKEEQKLSDAEEDILDYLKELEDYLTFHFVFIEKNQSQEAIKLHIQDVYPSRIKELFEAKSYVERSLGLKEFTFKTLGQFFWKWDKESKNRDLQKYFLELLDRIFRKIPYSEPLLIKFLLNGIRQAYKEELEGEGKKILYKSLDALASFLFVKATTEGVMFGVRSDDVKGFVESLPLLRLPEAKGLFVLGILTQRLLDKQAGSRGGNKPFLKKLSGFKLNERGFKKLMPELREKMEAYEVFGKFERELFDLASEYFAQSNEPWRLSLEEMNFIFAVGMGMKSKIYSAKSIQGGGSHD
jgi:CRISPR-associated protein Csh1